MTANSRHDNTGRDDDALERVIDDALEATLRAGAVDLRSRVLARLDTPVEEQASPRFVLFRPALVPVAGVVLLVVGVAFTWRLVDGQLSRAGAPPARPVTTARSAPGPSGTPAGMPRAAAGVSPAASVAAAAPDGERRHAAPGGADARIFAASWLAMDSASRPKAVAADSAIAGDEDAEPSFPGAPAGNLGDLIAPMPKLRPIVIPPIVAAPITDAPPVSTLATPVSTLSTDDRSRDRTDPGKPGGLRP